MHNVVISEAILMVRDLTRKQQEMLDYIIDFIKIKRRSPSYSEVAKGLGLKTRQNVHRVIKYLYEKGYLGRDENNNIIVLKDLLFDIDWLAQKMRALKEMEKEGLITKEQYAKLEKEVIEKFRDM